MTITQLKYVLAVAQYQNFTKAADKVFVTQPTLSMQIQKLEDELDVQNGEDRPRHRYRVQWQHQQGITPTIADTKSVKAVIVRWLPSLTALIP